MALVIHSQEHLEPHLQMDGVIMEEMLLTQVLLEAVVVLVVLVLLVMHLVPLLVDMVVQEFNFLQHIETQLVLWDSLALVVEDIGLLVEGEVLHIQDQIQLVKGVDLVDHMQELVLLHHLLVTQVLE